MKLIGTSLDLSTMAPAFLCDGMVGHLSRWLRLLGFDTEYAGSLLSDDEILDHLAASPRVLVTRDVQLDERARRRGLVSVRVAEAPLVDEIVQALRDSGTTVDPRQWFTRCTTCNGNLEPAAAGVVEHVPARVREAQTEFWKCAECGQVYWQGTHVEPIRETLAQVARRLSETR